MSYKKIKNFIFFTFLFACLTVTTAYARVHLEDFTNQNRALLYSNNPTITTTDEEGNTVKEEVNVPITVENGALHFDFRNIPQDGNWMNRYVYQDYVSAENNMYVGFTFERNAVENTRIRLVLRNYASSSNGQADPFYLDGDTLTLGNNSGNYHTTMEYAGTTGRVAVYAEDQGTDCYIKVWLNGELVHEYVEPSFNVKTTSGFQTWFRAEAKMDEEDIAPFVSFDNIQILQDEGLPNKSLHIGEPELQFDFENDGMFFVSKNTFPFYRVKSVRQLANFGNDMLTCENVLAQYGEQNRYKIEKKTLAPGEVIIAEVLDDAAHLDGVKTVKSFVWDNMENISPLVSGFAVDKSPIARADRPEVLAQKLTQAGGTHPRILTNATELAKVEGYKTEDDTFSDMYAAMLDWENGTMGSFVKAQIPKHGNELGSVCDRIYDRATIWGYLYQTTGDEQYAKKLMDDMLLVAAYPNWYDEVSYGSQGRFLYTAHIAAALAIGYDMTYDYLSREENIENRDIITKAIYDKAIKPFLAYHRADDRSGWSYRSDNWNMICNGGVGLACLAIGDIDDYRADCSIALNYALRGIRLVAEYFAPEGAWTEGFNYYPYMMRHGTDFFVALINTLGNDYGYRDFGGMNASASDAIVLAGSKYMYAYSDAPMTPAKGTPIMMYFAKYLDMPELGYYRRTQFEEKYAQVEASTLEASELQSVLNFRDLLWYDTNYKNLPENAGKPGYDAAYGLPLDFCYRGTGIVAMHSDYGDNQAFAAANFGKNNDWHNHTDMGGFVYESQGEQWFIELGFVDYSWQDNFNDLRYRNKPEGHNCMIFNPTGADDYDQILAAEGKLASEPLFGEAESYFVMDISSAYADRLNLYKRMIYLNKDTHGFAVKDKFTFKGENNEYYWFAHTKADIEISEDKKTAILTQNGKKLKVCVDNGEFTQMQAERLAQFSTASRLEPDPENTGVTKLAVHATGQSGTCEITVTAVPLDNSGSGTLPDISHIDF